MARVGAPPLSAHQIRDAGPTLAAVEGAIESAGKRIKEPSVGVRFSPMGVFFVRTGVYAVHAICAVCLVVAGRIYWELPGTILGGVFEMYKITLDKKYLQKIGLVHYAIGAMHLYVLAKALAARLYVILVPRPVRGHITGFQTRVHASILKRLGSILASDRARSFHGVQSKLRSSVKTVYQALFARDGVFGIESGHYELFFLARELTETILQSNQAYTMSRLLPRVRLNRFYVVILIINSWATPILHHVFRRNRSRQLLLCLLCDVVLDFVSSIGVPIVLAISYIDVYDFEWEDFEPWVWYNDKWLINIMNETPLIFCNSWVDLGSRLLFLLCLLASLEDVRTLVKPRTGLLESKAAIAPASESPVVAGDRSHHGKREASVARIVKWVHRLMVVYGFAILAAFLHAESKPSPTACVLELRPWLVSMPACALVEINCHLDPSRTGNRDDFEAITSKLDSSSLEQIAIRHCPQVEFTPRLQAFTNLLGIKIYNSTVLSWDDEAALTSTRHKRIRFVYFPFTMFPNNTLPPGLISKDFPLTLRDFRVTVSNIQWIPDDLHERWPPVMTILFELTLLDSVPPTLTKLQPWFLSLMGNSITEYPREAFEDNNIQQIMLLGNMITVLPESVDPSRVSMSGIFLDSTNLSAIPQWMDAAFLSRTWVTAGGSPICRDILLNPNSTEGQALGQARPYLLTLLDCAEFPPWPTYRLDLEVRADEVW